MRSWIIMNRLRRERGVAGEARSIDPENPDRLILGNDGGLYMSHDRGETWLHLNNFPIGEFYAVWVDMDEPYNIYGGTQDNAALYGPSTHNVEDRLTKYGVEDP